MKITSQILSIPPYISTRWEHVAALRAIGNNDVEVVLTNGNSIAIPNLDKETIDLMFSSHIAAAENQLQHVESSAPSSEQPFVRQEDLNQFIHTLQSGVKDILATLLKLGSSAVSSFGKTLEHDPKSANTPLLTEEMRDKVLMLLNIVPKEDILAMPAPEPGCNCMYCQINRILRDAIQQEQVQSEVPYENQEKEGEEEIVDESDLEFSEWIVTPVSDKLYLVQNKLDSHEEYRVFLGNPIGCTCGKPNCEHIIAVLRS